MIVIYVQSYRTLSTVKAASSSVLILVSFVISAGAAVASVPFWDTIVLVGTTAWPVNDSEVRPIFSSICDPDQVPSLVIMVTIRPVTTLLMQHYVRFFVFVQIFSERCVDLWQCICSRKQNVCSLALDYPKLYLNHLRMLPRDLTNNYHLDEYMRSKMDPGLVCKWRKFAV